MECHWDEKMAFKDGVDDGFVPGLLLVSYVVFEYGIIDIFIIGIFIGY